MKRFLFLMCALFTINISAQNIHTGYNSNSFILQSIANPSSFPNSDVVVGFPGLSNLSYGLQSPITLNELFTKGDDDSLRIDFPSLSSYLSDNNLLNIGGRNQLFYLGLKVGKKKNVFVYIGDEIVSDISIGVPGNLFDFLNAGNANSFNQQINFNDQRFDISIYNSLYVGVSSDINDKLNIGTRIKFLNGLANVNTQKLNLSIFTDSTSIPIFETTLKSDIQIQTSGLGLITDTLNFDPLLNSGIGFDIGGSYKFNKELELSFSINDIGVINWVEENNQFYTTNGEATYVLQGLTHSSSVDNDFEAQLDEITDSLQLAMEPYSSTGSYETKLNPSMFLGLAYEINDKHSLSFLFHSKKNLDGNLNVFNLGYQFSVAESLQLLASYQNFNGLSNIGSGFVWSPGVLQMHLILDNLLAADLFDTKSLFLQLGCSFQFGKKSTVVRRSRRNGLR